MRAFLLLPFVVATLHAQGLPPALVPSASQGVVFDDRNANGVRDGGEAGLAGVVVSNQEEVVRTGADGRFALARGGTGAVFVVVPRHKRATTAWWQRADASAVAFGLTAAPEPPTVTFVHASDTHIQESSVVRTQRLRAVVDSLRPAFTIVTGDLVRDALRVGEAEASGYYALFAKETAAFRGPLFTVPGNHEIFGVERTRSGVSQSHPLYGRGMYRAYRGPDYYSFDAGGVHIVALNTIDVDDQWYHGHVDSLQMAWLARDLAMVPEGTPVVTFNHIPFYSVGEQLNGYTDQPPAPSLITVGGKTVFRHTVDNAGEVIRAVAPHPYAMAIGGHIHIGERITFILRGRPMRFHNGAATVSDTPSGAFTFPSGVTLYRITDGVVDDGTFVPLGATRTP